MVMLGFFTISDPLDTGNTHVLHIIIHVEDGHAHRMMKLHSKVSKQIRSKNDPESGFCHFTFHRSLDEITPVDV